MAKILALTDMDLNGSGYYYLMSQLFTGLSKLGYDIKVAGVNYYGQPHNHPFSIIPGPTIQDAAGICHNLELLWKPDIFLVAMDIPVQKQIYEILVQLQSKYVAITALENGPLTLSWSAVLAPMKHVFFISELGKQEALKTGLQNVDHLRVGVDTDFWHIPTPEERSTLRKGMGIEDDEFVIFTNSDNQERKNLWAAFEIVSRLKKLLPNQKFRFILITRQQSPFGWNLQDLAMSTGIVKEYMPFERGMPLKDLWGLYAMSDLFLHTSKAEGLGMPVLEAEACGVPVIATYTGALSEHIQNAEFLIPASETYIDVWGNSLRKLIDIDYAVQLIQQLLKSPIAVKQAVIDNRKYVEGRQWTIPVQHMDNKLKELFNGKTE